MTALHHNSCLSCGGALRYLFPGAAGDIWKCEQSECGLALVTDQPSDLELSTAYERLYYRAEPTDRLDPVKENSNEGKFQQHFDALDQAIGIRGKRILDFGCGIGNFLSVAIASGAGAAVGIESNETARQEARIRGFEIAANVNELTNEKFDLIYMNDVIEHLRDPVETCVALNQLLDKNGQIFVTTINLDSLKARLVRARWDMVRDPTHLYFFNSRSLAQVLTNAGFEDPVELHFPVKFGHHGLFRRLCQRGLVSVGLSSSLKMVARKPIGQNNISGTN